MSNSLAFQGRLTEAIKEGKVLVAGEELSDLAQVGDQVVVITCRIVDVEKLPGEVQLVLTNHGMVNLSGEQPGLAVLESAESQKLDAFYVEAPESNFNSAITELTGLDGVTVTTNFVSAPAEPASGEESQSAEEKTRSFNFAQNEGVANKPSDQPEASANGSASLAPLVASAPASEAAPPAEQAVAEESLLGAKTEARMSKTAAIPADGYQVAVRAQAELVQKLQEQERFDYDTNDFSDLSARPAPPQRAANGVFRQNVLYFANNGVQGPPPAPDRVRAVILVVPEKAE
jgi:hypothetical protein